MDKITSQVRSFYNDHPFNSFQKSSTQVEIVRRLNVNKLYPSITGVLNSRGRVIEIGCGTGWLACHIALRYGCSVTGIDCSEVSIGLARRLAAELGVCVEFRADDLFSLDSSNKFDLALAFGVLHHTRDWERGLHRCLEICRSRTGQCAVGLYHKCGRRPFLDHFGQLKASGVGVEVLRSEYQKLHPHKDPVQQESWFRDQVCHPHETQHSLREVVAAATKVGWSVRSTSINRYGALTESELEKLCDGEDQMESVAQADLARGVYNAGFFVTHLVPRI